MKTPQHWQHLNLLSAALTPLSWLYGLGAACDRHFTTPVQAPVPVISVGNITAGGAGKTPTTLALIPLLQSLASTPHILTRGYGGDSLHAHRVDKDDDFRRVGDEALLLARHSVTWVGRDRLASAQAAANAGASVLVCDDALQHHALRKDVSLLVIDGGVGFGNGKLLPAGPLRESLSTAMKRVDAAIVIGEDRQHVSSQISCPIFTARLLPTGDTSPLQDKRYLAFAGLGRPHKFFDTLSDLGATIVGKRSFPDHYPYSEHDLNQLFAEATALNATLITTEKDAVKLPTDWRDKVEVLPVSLRFDAPEKLTEWLKGKLDQRAT